MFADIACGLCRRQLLDSWMFFAPCLSQNSVFAGSLDRLISGRKIWLLVILTFEY